MFKYIVYSYDYNGKLYYTDGKAWYNDDCTKRVGFFQFWYSYFCYWKSTKQVYAKGFLFKDGPTRSGD